MLPTSVSLMAFLLLVSRVQALSCYTPNGEDRNTQTNVDNLGNYAPCNPSANNSMCCAWGPDRTNSGSADSCLPNGLCANGALVWRESCTDITWQAPECLKLFVNGTGYGSEPIIYDDDNNPLTDVTVTQCDDGSFCYGTDNRACCQQGQGAFLNAQGVETNVSPSASGSSTSFSSSTSSSASTSSLTSSSPTSTSTSTTSQAPPSSTSSPSSSSSSLSTGTKAGIGAGVGGAALIAMILGACWYVRRRKKQKTQKSQPVMAENPQYTQSLPRKQDSELQIGGTGKDYLGPHPRSELDSPGTSRASRTDVETKSSLTAVEMP